MNKPLAGIKVANFCWYIAGPLTVRYLAAWGATVVRVENHRRPDVIRMVFPYQNGVPHFDNGPFFANSNAGYLSVTIDLGRESGRKIAWKLLEWSDVVAESFSPGTMARYGLDYESVRKKRPDIVYYTSSMLGSEGPLCQFSGIGFHTTCLSGIVDITGWADQPPVMYPGAYTDFVSPRYGAAAILAALHHRKRTGRGQLIDVSQMESASLMIGPALMNDIHNGVGQERDGNHSPSACPHNVYPCKGEDEWCAIAVYDEQQWQRLAGAIDRPELGENPEFRTLENRKEREKELDEQIAKWTSQRSAQEVEQTLQAAGVPGVQVATIPSLHEDQQLWQRGYFRKLDHKYMGPHVYRATGFNLSRSEDSLAPGPCLGEHNEHVLHDILGLSDDEIAEALIDGGITNEGQLPGLKPTA